MREDDREKLTLEERIARSARSQAASPETAACLVQKLSRLYTGDIFHGTDDLELMYGLIGPYMEQVEDDLLHYAGFCHSINFSFTADVPPGKTRTPFQPVLGLRTSNAVVLLGLMLLDHAKGRGRDKEVYHCTRMTLGQYLDALEALAFPRDEDAGRKFRRWRELFLKRCAPSAPLADVLASLLRQYIHGWKMINCLDHVLGCMEELTRCLEAERTADLDREFRETMRQCIAELNLTDVEVVEEEEREQYPDPAGHYFDLALDYSWEAPDPAGEGISARDVRAQIFLPDLDYSPQAVEKLAEQAPTPAFRALLERFVAERWLPNAASETDDAISNLFMMWVGPYLWMKEGPR